MKDCKELYKIIRKIKNNELLDEFDLMKFAELLRDEYDLRSLISTYSEPAYANGIDMILVNADTKAEWIQHEISRFVDGMLIKVYLDSKKAKVPTTVFDYNILLLNAVAHEVRHAYQPAMLMKKDIYTKEDITFLKNMLKSINKLSVFKNMFFHDYLYFEYDADLNAAMKISEFNELYLNKNLDYYNEYVAYKILRAYTSSDGKKKSTPIINNNEIYGRKFKNKNVDYMNAFNYLKDLEDSPENILNGGKVEDKLLENLKDIYMGDTKVKDIRKVLK